MTSNLKSHALKEELFGVKRSERVLHAKIRSLSFVIFKDILFFNVYTFQSIVLISLKI